MNVLIVPDKFKGTLTAAAAAEAMARGWHSVRPSDQLDLLPMSDGGDGFGEVMGRLWSATPQTIRTIDAAHRPIEATWWWSAPQKTAIIETARIVGLALLPRGKFHPFDLDTFGLGAVVREVIRHGATRCLVGIGGSATNDAGFGLARSLGWEFLNEHEEPLTRWTELAQLSQIRPPADPAAPGPEVIVAVDVQNPLLGPNGCSRIYGPQKGLTEFDEAERHLGRLAEISSAYFHADFAAARGAGAAGGLGFGLAAFLRGKFQSGFEIFADASGLEERIRHSQLVLSGEGALDGQTLMGKGVGEIGLRCQKARVPCIGLAGVVPRPEEARRLFTAAHALLSLTDKESALREPAVWLERLAAKVATDWSRSERA